jgi:hypothetical protein
MTAQSGRNVSPAMNTICYGRKAALRLVPVKVPALMPVNYESVSNEIDESELQCAKHTEQSISTYPSIVTGVIHVVPNASHILVTSSVAASEEKKTDEGAMIVSLAPKCSPAAVADPPEMRTLTPARTKRPPDIYMFTICQIIIIELNCFRSRFSVLIIVLESGSELGPIERRSMNVGRLSQLEAVDCYSKRDQSGRVETLHDFDVVPQPLVRRNGHSFAQSQTITIMIVDDRLPQRPKSNSDSVLVLFWQMLYRYCLINN